MQGMEFMPVRMAILHTAVVEEGQSMGGGDITDWPIVVQPFSLAAGAALGHVTVLAVVVFRA
jgi:hypothetical protein